MTLKDNITTDRHLPERCFPPQAEVSEITVHCPRARYSASDIARAVEDCDAHLLNLNVTALPADSSDDVVIDLRVNVRNGYSVARSLERYGFTVDDVVADGPDPLAETFQNRIDLLIKNLEL